MSLPTDFLTQLEQYSELSNREKAVFLEIFGNGKSRVKVTQRLNISDSNLSSCLTGIYKKFSISGNGPVKETRLREYLEKRYSQQKPSDSSTTDIAENDVDALVQEICEKVKLSVKEKCGTMRVLDMPQPIELTGERGIYTNVNILEKITGRRRLDIPELLQNCDPEHFDHFGLSRVTEKRVSGLEVVQRYSKLMVLGKPGAGKTTFLKYLAMQCIEGQFLTNQVPLFITLKDFAEAPRQLDILKYIAQQLSRCGVKDASIRTDQVLRQGKALVLLDGLDEVREEDTKRVLRQILNLSEQFHTNQFMITCRIAAKEYTFEQFTEVEMADFDQEQIAIFAENWFRLSDPMKSQRFIQKLKENKPVLELATNPLLLTLLCLVFGESADFPANRSELYKEGLDVLLKKWDAKRNIERDQIYKNLSLQRKEDLLSQIALTTFEQKNYFFKQKIVEAHIADFISNLRDADLDPEVLRLDSEAGLKSIEAQHGLLVERAKGIYSFSHLTFQEYFAAREIVANSAWENLVEHITEIRWQEVFLLTVGMMRKADDLLRLMKQKIDAIVEADEKLQQFLWRVHQKSLSVKSIHKPAAVRAFYFEHALFFSYSVLDSLDYAFACHLGLNFCDLGFEPQLEFDYGVGLEPELEFDYIFTDVLYFANAAQDELFAYALALPVDIEPKFRQSLQNLKEQIPYLERQEKWKQGKVNKLKIWENNLRSLFMKYRNIFYEDEFSDKQYELIWDYYNANELLLDCINSDCYISREARREIEETLLLPMNKLKNKN
ncbi:MAG: NACHT domain-containing NTPase [Nostoc sp.]|uniref:NACHT domain-containing protein n=1 Tax=Nostoc sp. TaxID=1180 RepID=UPI002FF9196F